MALRQALVGRERAGEALGRALDEAAGGHGGLVLLAGEAGVGKTRLANELLEQTGLAVLKVPSSAAAGSAYGPIVGALRAFRRGAPDQGVLVRNPLGAYLSRLLPELGLPPPVVDRATLFEAVRNAFEIIARQRPSVVFLDDLQAADSATLELLVYLATQLDEVGLLVLGAYRSDELGRDHPVRRMRMELRRAGRLREIQVELLGPAETATLAARLLGGQPSAALARLMYERSDGLPLFIEELATELTASGRLRPGPAGLELAADSRLLPVPQTVRDLVLARAGRLSEQAQAALEVAAVAGVSFDLQLVSELAGSEDGLGEALHEGLLVQPEPGTAAFRHALVREVLYADLPWPRRRALHRQLAERLQWRPAPAAVLAEHWLAAREPERARRALLVAMASACEVHAYTDAARAARRALELWPDAELESERLAVLDRLGHCAQLTGNLADAASAWREVLAGYELRGDARQRSEVQRCLAGVYELQGSWERALAARRAAAEGFASQGMVAESATERLAAAIHLRLAGSFTAASAELALASEQAERAARLDLRARVMGLQGNLQARTGQHQAGLELVRAGLALALEHNLTAAAAEVYQRLADALEHTGNYAAARQTYAMAADFCQAQGAPAVAKLCLACMTVVLRQTGEWQHCTHVCREVLASEASSTHARTVALGMLGSIYAQQGEPGRARPPLLESARLAGQIELAPMQILSGWGLALVDELEGAADRAAERCRGVLERWAQTEERHYAIPAMRWAATLFGTRGANADVRACANALARIVGETSVVEAVAALGHALGEVSLLEGQPDQAAQHFAQSLRHLTALELPYERAHTSLRAGLAWVAAGERESGTACLVDAYRVARKLGARPLANEAARVLATLGEPVDRRLGRRAAGALERGGLTRRELEVLRLVAGGHTDRDIARVLVLSSRTVEMHVANGLSKLGCRSRAEAVRRASELRLFDLDPTP
jgi:DNA-binding CsgD family transcriptional regulator